MSDQYLIRMIDRAVASLRAAITATAARVTITDTDDSGGVQTAKVTGLANERFPAAERLQEFGFSSRPMRGTGGVILCIGGSRAHPVLIACDDRSTRFVNLAAGESAQYNAFGDFIRIRESGEIEIKARVKVTCDAPLTHALGDAEVDGTALVHGDAMIEGDVEILGNLTVTGAISSATSVSDPAGTLQSVRAAHNTHAHGGVDTGSGTSGGPTVAA